jgi:CheY-like chemotaxis protein
VSKRKLLLADDSVTIQKVVNLTFADEGIEVISVSDGDSAMTKILEVSPDIVMLDVNMPGLNGYQICENLRKSEQFKRLPVILLVGSFEPFDEDESRRVGANEYLTKPFQSIRQLVTTVTNLLGSGEIPNIPSFNEEIEEIKTAETVAVRAETPFVFSPMSSFSEKSEIESSEPKINEEVAEQDTPEIGSFYSSDPAEVRKEIQFPHESDSAYVPKESNFRETFEERIVPSYSELDSTWDDEIEVSKEAESSVKEAELPVIDEPIVESPVPFAETSEEVVPDRMETEAITEEFTDTSNDEDFQTITHESSEVLKDDEAIEIEEIRETSNEPAVESFPFPEAASILQLDEDDLLEIAPREEDFLVNMNYDNDFDSEIRFDDVAFGESAFDVTPHSVAAPVINKEMKYEIDQATIDEIVDRVIEKLSDSVVREVAWEVVPTKADAIIKQIAEKRLENS